MPKGNLWTTFVQNALTSPPRGEQNVSLGSSAAGWGALLGGLVGLLLGPLGLMVGPFSGAVLVELIFTRKSLLEAVKSGVGTLLGLLGGIGAKLVIHIVMGALVLLRIFSA